MTLKFDGWHWKTTGHLFCTASSVVHHFKSIGESKLELQSGNAHLGLKLKYFVPCDLEIWWMTSKSNRATLLYHIKLCASFLSHHGIQTGLKPGNGQFGSKSAIFCPVWPLKFNGLPWKSIGHIFYAASSFAYHFIAIGEFKLESQSGNAPIWVKINDFFSRVTLRPWNAHHFCQW